ncbi:MAG: helix-turn-helix domain-containing protein [Chloroflexota bacterium]|nr:helix-turn-helix domain-containing protein [Chloroflexota bacterium]
MASDGVSRFGRLLRRHREAAALSQAGLAERAGLSERGISDLERGRRKNPRLETVRLLAEALGLAADDRAALLAAARQPVAPKPAPVSRSTVPIPPTSLIGREREVATAVALLRREDVRLVTLTGPGGVGKTRLAVAAASGTGRAFADGVRFVPLAPVRDTRLVTSVITHTLGLPDGNEPALDQLLRHFRDRHLLLVLDNLEHLLAAAPQISILLAACPDLAVLATSRERLHLDGEHEFPVSPLATPECSRPSSTEALASVAAVRLFVERARDIDPAFALTDDNASAVAEICRRLDGLPLAIELAAARTKVLPPRALLARLERRLPLLTGERRDAPERQRTLRDTIAWSYDLLTPAERTFFRRLAVFVGGLTLEAAAAVVWAIAAGEPGGHEASITNSGHSDDAELDRQTSTLNLITSLVDKSLLRRDEREGGAAAAEPRFEMLETVREFALERLEGSGELAAARQAHADYFLMLAERAEPEVVGREQGLWLERLTAEIGNMRAALDWALDRGAGSSEISLRLAGALWTFWYMSARNREGRQWLERALAASEDTITAPRARALMSLGTVFATLSEFARAEPLLEAAATAWQALGNSSGTGRALQILSQTLQQQNDHDRAMPLLEQSLTLYGPPGEGLPEDQPWLGLALGQLADAALAAGDIDRGLGLAEEGLAFQRALGSQPGIGYGLFYYAMALTARGEDARAIAAYQESISRQWEQGDKWSIMFFLPWLLALALKQGSSEQVARLAGAFEVLHEEFGHPLAPRQAVIHEQVLATARAALGRTAFAAARAAGRALSLEQAVAEAMALAAAGIEGAEQLTSSVPDS